MNQYEAMFLFDPTFGASFENCETEIRRLMDRAEGELVFCRKWDDRRLAFKIRGCKRGVYVLTYFKAKPEKVVSLERDVRLSENILRVLVLRADDVTPEAMERAMSLGSQQAVGENGPTERSRDHVGGPVGSAAKPAATPAAPVSEVVETAKADTDVED